MLNQRQPNILQGQMNKLFQAKQQKSMLVILGLIVVLGGGAFLVNHIAPGSGSSTGSTLPVGSTTPTVAATSTSNNGSQPLNIQPYQSYAQSSSQGQSTTPWWQTVLSVSLNLGLVLVIVYAAIRILAHFQGKSVKKTTADGTLSLERSGQLQLTSKSSVHVVKVGNKTLLLGCTDQQVSILSDLTEEPAKAALEQPVPEVKPVPEIDTEELDDSAFMDSLQIAMDEKDTSFTLANPEVSLDALTPSENKIERLETRDEDVLPDELEELLKTPDVELEILSQPKDEQQTELPALEVEPEVELEPDPDEIGKLLARKFGLHIDAHPEEIETTQLPALNHQDVLDEAEEIVAGSRESLKDQNKEKTLEQKLDSSSKDSQPFLDNQEAESAVLEQAVLQEVPEDISAISQPLLSADEGSEENFTAETPDADTFVSEIAEEPEALIEPARPAIVVEKAVLEPISSTQKEAAPAVEPSLENSEKDLSEAEISAKYWEEASADASNPLPLEASETPIIKIQLLASRYGWVDSRDNLLK